MNSRLIPWCLAATGFLAALTVCTWQGELGGPGQRLQPQVAADYRRMPPATDHRALRSSPAQAAPEAPQTPPETLALPLPPATQPEPDLNRESVVDDAPTVEDLPARLSEPESSQDE